MAIEEELHVLLCAGALIVQGTVNWLESPAQTQKLPVRLYLEAADLGLFTQGSTLSVQGTAAVYCNCNSAAPAAMYVGECYL